MNLEKCTVMRKISLLAVKKSVKLLSHLEAFIKNKKSNKEMNSAIHCASTCFQQDTAKNPEQFPQLFFKGTGNGFWWSFISMTTVG